MFAFPYNNEHGGTPFVYVTTQERHPITVMVVVPDVGFSQDTVVTHIQSATIQLPLEAAVTASTTGKNGCKAIIVDASDAVSVYGSYSSTSGTDSFLILPTKALGTDYVAVGYDSHSSLWDTSHSEFVISAIDDNTSVNIAGQSPLTLQKHECYQYVGLHTDITGISVKASKPISVMSGHQWAALNFNLQCGDYFMENLPPVNLLGHHYILSPFLSKTWEPGFIYRVVSVSPGITSVSIVPGKIVSLSAGEFYEGNTTSLFDVLTVTADKPVIVSQYGFSCDPFMIVIPSTQHFSHNVTFPTTSSMLMFDVNPRHFISIMSQCDSMDLFYLDNILLNPRNLLRTSDGEFCVLRTSVTAGGFHSVTHPFASFLVRVYGVDYEAYGYVAGYQVQLSDTSEGGKFQLSPIIKNDLILLKTRNSIQYSKTHFHGAIS